MQDVYTFAGLTSASCQSMCNPVGTLLEHLIISKPLDGSDSYTVWW